MNHSKSIVLNGSDSENEYEHKLHAIQSKLIKLREQRELVSPKPYVNHKAPPKTPEKVKKVKRFHHPHLDYVMFEIANSPYLTPAPKAYSSLTVNLVEKSQVLRTDDTELKPISKRKIKMAKKKFVEDIINWRVDFQFPHPKEFSKVSRSKSDVGLSSPSRKQFNESLESEVTDTDQEYSPDKDDMKNGNKGNNLSEMSKSLPMNPSRPYSRSKIERKSPSPVRGGAARNRRQLQAVTKSRKEQAEHMNKLSKPVWPAKPSEEYVKKLNTVEVKDKEEVKLALVTQKSSIIRLSSPKSRPEDNNEDHLETRPVSPQLPPASILQSVTRLATPKHKRSTNHEPSLPSGVILKGDMRFPVTRGGSPADPAYISRPSSPISPKHNTDKVASKRNLMATEAISIQNEIVPNEVKEVIEEAAEQKNELETDDYELEFEETTSSPVMATNNGVLASETVKSETSITKEEEVVPEAQTKDAESYEDEYDNEFEADQEKSTKGNEKMTEEKTVEEKEKEMKSSNEEISEALRTTESPSVENINNIEAEDVYNDEFLPEENVHEDEQFFNNEGATEGSDVLNDIMTEKEKNKEEEDDVYNDEFSPEETGCQNGLNKVETAEGNMDEVDAKKLDERVESKEEIVENSNEIEEQEQDYEAISSEQNKELDVMQENTEVEIETNQCVTSENETGNVTADVQINEPTTTADVPTDTIETENLHTEEIVSVGVTDAPVEPVKTVRDESIGSGEVVQKSSRSRSNSSLSGERGKGDREVFKEADAIPLTRRDSAGKVTSAPTKRNSSASSKSSHSSSTVVSTKGTPEAGPVRRTSEPKTRRDSKNKPPSGRSHAASTKPPSGPSKKKSNSNRSLDVPASAVDAVISASSSVDPQNVQINELPSTADISTNPQEAALVSTNETEDAVPEIEKKYSMSFDEDYDDNSFADETVDLPGSKVEQTEESVSNTKSELSKEISKEKEENENESEVDYYDAEESEAKGDGSEEPNSYEDDADYEDDDDFC